MGTEEVEDPCLQPLDDLVGVAHPGPQDQLGAVLQGLQLVVEVDRVPWRDDRVPLTMNYEHGNVPEGLGPPDADGLFVIDIADNAMNEPILAADTAQFVQFQVRFRAIDPDPGPTADSIGMFINDFLLEWQMCDLNPCAPGLVDDRVSDIDLPVTAGTGDASGRRSMSTDRTEP